MFDVISKTDLFGWVAQGLPFDKNRGLKAMQDAFILSQLGDKSGQRALEVGGGNSRVLPLLAKANECWNYDSFDGRDGGPKKVLSSPGVKVVVGRMGDRSESVPGSYFDTIFSISVMEHVPADKISDVFSDIARVLRPGGITMHAIDVYMLDALHAADPYNETVWKRLDAYRSAASNAGLELAVPDRVLRHPYFSSAYASNPDFKIMEWNKVVPSLTGLRKKAQSVSLKAIWRKP